jgi:hypothetical protein
MCGIVGIVNGEGSRSADLSITKLFEQALVCNSLRGDDSTGLFQLDAKKLYSYKAAKAGWDFVNDPKASGFLRDTDSSRITIGHNRAATTGDILDATAHPFTAEKANKSLLIGVHNGTLQGWNSVKYDVDSEWAMNMIAEQGDEAFALFKGAFAFVWYDQDEKDKLFIARNADRPMFAGYIKDTNRMLLASEPEMMAWLCRRNGLSLEPEVLDLKPERKYTFDVTNPRQFSSSPLPQAVTPAAVYNEGEWQPGWSRRGRSRGYSVVNTQEQMVNSMLALLKPAEVTPAVVTPAPTGAKVRMKFKVHANEEEMRLAKVAAVAGVECSFMGDVYDSDSYTLYGEAELDGDSTRAVMRHVSPGAYEFIRKEAVVPVVIVGAFPVVDNVSGAREMSFVVRRNNSSKDADSIADAVSQEIDKLRNNAVLH